jgi:hypothetical protein
MRRYRQAQDEQAAQSKQRQTLEAAFAAPNDLRTLSAVVPQVKQARRFVKAS